MAAVRAVTLSAPSCSLATARVLTSEPWLNATVAFSRSPAADCTVSVPVPASRTVVTLSIAPVIDDAGMPDSAGIVTTRSLPGTTIPAGSRRES